MQYCIFSYNRGQYLENCVKSLEHCAPGAKATIFDDNSNDPTTLAVLERLSAKHSLVVPKFEQGQANKCGGLYNNMQLALDSAPDDSLLCFIQDDTQLVRTVTAEDIAAVHRFFEARPEAAFFQPAFLRAYERDRDSKSLVYDASAGAYFRHNAHQSAGVHYSAISIAHVGRLRQASWRFEQREKYNDAQAKKLFGLMGLMKNPFLAWLPNVPAYRGKTKTMALQWAEKHRNCGFYPFRYMDEVSAEQFIARSEKQLPFAEDYLELKHGSLPEPWISYPLQGSMLLRHLNRLELVLRKRLPKKG